jgi:flagellar biosynthesis protein FlhG
MSDIENKAKPAPMKKDRRKSTAARVRAHRARSAAAASAPPPFRPRRRTIAVTSGKGGVGKTNIVTNLAIALARQGVRVLVLEGPDGIRVVPASSGVEELANLDEYRTEVLLRKLGELESETDIILIDSPSGIGHHATTLVQGADQILVVTTPEPTSFSDAYAMIKVLTKRPLRAMPALLVNQADSEDSALAVARRVRNVAKRFLNLDLDYWGYILADESVPKSVLRQEPFLSTYPYSPAASCVYQLARRVLGQPVRNGNPGQTPPFSLVSRDGVPEEV